MKPQVRKAIGLIVAVLVLYVPVIYWAKFDTKKEIIISPTTVTVSQQANQPVERLTETSDYDYSENMVVGNKLRIDPTTVSHADLSLGIGDIWYDALTDRVMLYDGTEPGGMQIVPKMDRILIDSTAINGGDSVQFLPPAGVGKHYIIDKLIWKYTEGTAYAGTGTDTTFICSLYMGVKNKLGYVDDAMFTSDSSKFEVVVLNGGVDENSPLWVDFAPHYTTGTGTVELIPIYIKL